MKSAASNPESAEVPAERDLSFDCPACQTVVQPSFFPPLLPEVTCAACATAWMMPMSRYVNLWARFIALVLGVVGVAGGIALGLYMPLPRGTAIYLQAGMIAIAALGLGAAAACVGIPLGYAIGYLLAAAQVFVASLRGPSGPENERL